MTIWVLFGIWISGFLFSSFLDGLEHTEHNSRNGWLVLIGSLLWPVLLVHAIPYVLGAWIADRRNSNERRPTGSAT